MPVLTTYDTAHETRLRILDAAELLFARDGFKTTSLRAITTQAEVNVALVNYHFGTKDSLINQVLLRTIRPLNEKRLELLAQAYENAETKPVPLEKILEALIRPCLAMSTSPQHAQVVQLLERAMTEKYIFSEAISQEWKPLIAKFAEALQQTLPLSLEQIHWGLHYTVGAMIHTCCHHQDLTLLSDNQCHLEFESTLRRLIAYTSGGLYNLASLAKGQRL